MSEAFCRLTLSVFDRVRYQSCPWTQWHCDRTLNLSFSVVKVNLMVLHALSHTDNNAVWSQH